MKQPEFDLVGHRGARGLLPENTIPSMLLALDLGVTTLELDVHISQDKQVFLSHDPQLNPAHEFLPATETVATSDALPPWYTLPYHEIRKYDVGSRYYAEFPKQHQVQAHKPLLTEVIEAVKAYEREKERAPVWLNIELKATPETDYLHHPPPQEYVELVMQAIQEKQVQDQVIIQSFDVRLLQALHPAYPHIITALLVENDADFKSNLASLGYTPCSYNPWYRLVTPDLVAACHANKIKIVPWTVNTLEEMRYLKQLGVDGIITDYPTLFRHL